MYLSKNIKHLRTSKNLKQLEVCATLNFKTSTWNNYERGLSSPNYSDLLRISHFFEVNAGDLLEVDLSNPYLNKSKALGKSDTNPHLNPSPNPHLNTKKGSKEPCKECDSKDILIQVKDQLLHSKQELIEQLNTNIKLLQNHIDIMEYERREAAETQHTPRRERKSA